MLHGIDFGKTTLSSLAGISCLVEALNREGVAFCHWKSNLHLKEALAEGGELDLLVDRQDAGRFESVLASLDFKRAIDPVAGSFPSVSHFYGLDRAASELIHLHVYYRIITGESLLKNYCFPLEELLLQNPRWVEGVPIPQASAELILFVIRMMLKHTTVVEYLLLRGRRRSGYETMRTELEALLSDDAATHSAGLLAKWLPSVDHALFDACVAALRQDAFVLRRFWLALRLRRQLRSYNRLSFVPAFFQQTILVLRLLSRRLRHRGKPKQFASGGALIAFVGPEATGKSTLVQETAAWLAKAFDVSTAHLGKPPSSWLTFLPNLTLPLLRKIAPQHRASQVESQPDSGDSRRVSLLYAFRAVLLAWDRHALAVKLARKAANGAIVICDRYPSALVGAMDSARLKIGVNGEGMLNSLLGYLAKLESRIYQQIPPPDVVIRLTVPVEVAIERNHERQKKGKEGDAYVLRRHTTSIVPSFPTAKTIELDSDQPRTQTISSVRQILWDVL